MGATEVDDKRETVAKRAEFVELLDKKGELQPSDIVDKLDQSRSTVTRALRELREDGIVEKRNDGYIATVTGVMAVKEYRRHEATSQAILTSKKLVEPLPDPRSLPPTLLARGQTHLTDESGPFRPLEKVSERVREADEINAYLPRLVNPHLLRVWYQKVTNERIASVGIFDDNLLMQLKGQYPKLLAEMGALDSFSAFTGDGPPFALFLTKTEESCTVSVVIYDGETGIRGVVINSSEAAVEWAENRFDTLTNSATDLTDDLSTLAGAVEHGVPELQSTTSNTAQENNIERDGGFAGHALPLSLQSEGFVRLSTEYFQTHEQASPEVSWQTGFTLPEIRAGHAVERVDDGQCLTDRLIDRLQSATDQVILGPPGSGKSTTCMSVACEWYDRQLGPVLYREHGGGDAFGSPAVLEAYLRQLDEHALVVVEDAIRSEASDIFEVMQALDEHSGVTFLLDSRTSEWDDPDDFIIDARTDSYRQSSIEQTLVPRLDEEDCSRFIGHFERLVGDEVRVSGEELTSTIHRKDTASKSNAPEPGEILLLQSHLSQRIEKPSKDDSIPSNILDEGIQGVYQTIGEADEEYATEVAVLVNILNAAGIPIATEYLYSVAPNEDFAQVEEAISLLKGCVLFDKQGRGTHATEYRTYHEMWSTRFLKQLLDVQSEHSAKDIFGRCVSRLLNLSEDREYRTEIKRQLRQNAPHIHQIESDPDGWANEVAERIFNLGESHAFLAPLYGETDDDTITLPETCSCWIQYWQSLSRGKMNIDVGGFNLAEQELEQLLDDIRLDAGLNNREVRELKAHGHWHLGKMALIEEDFDKSKTHYKRSLSLAEEDNDIQTQTKARLGIASLDLIRGNINQAAEQADSVIDIVSSRDHPKLEASAMAISGVVAYARGADLERKQQYEQVLSLARKSSDKGLMMRAFFNLAAAEVDRNNFNSAKNNLSKSLEIARDRGLQQDKEFIFHQYGKIACKCGNIKSAAESFERALELSQESEIPVGMTRSLLALSQLEYYRGRLDDAEEYSTKALEYANNEVYLQQKVRINQNLAKIAVRRKNIDDAESYLKSARNKESFDNDLVLAECDRIKADLELERGDYDEADYYAKQCLDRLCDFERGDKVADCLRIRGLVALEREDIETATEHLHDGLEKATDSGVLRVVGRVNEALAQLEMERNNEEQAKKHLQRAKNAFLQLDNVEQCPSIQDISTRQESTN